MNLIFLSFFLMVILPSILCDDHIFRLDITPEEAQKFISEQKIQVDYANKIGEQHEIPILKNQQGDTIYQGRIIDNPSDYIEDEYLAKQHHGQDGLGRYLFNYEDWNQGRMEAKNANGEIRGQYKYRDNLGDGDEIVVNYWADSLGFHQEDNLPKTILEPVTDEPAVQLAKEEHLRRWKLAAEAAKIKPDPMSDVYNRLANQYDEHRAQLDQANEIVGHSGEIILSRNEQKTYWQPNKNEIISEPRGFFYSFEYPVKVLRNIKDNENVRKLKRESSETKIVNDNDNDKTKLDINDDRISAVHDVQIPKIRKVLVRRSILNGNKSTKYTEKVQLKRNHAETFKIVPKK